MKIVIKQLAKCTIEDFADEHGLTMVVEEMSNLYAEKHYAKYLARFEGAEDKDDKHSNTLTSTYGDGGTPDEAIKRYANKMSGRLLVFNAASKDKRKEIQCPIFIK